MALSEEKITKANKLFTLSGSLQFTRYFFKHRFNRKFVIGEHHRIISKALDRVMSGECLRLMINIAPRYGKTEQAVKNFIAEGLARSKGKAKFIHLSYSDDLALDNSEEIREFVSLPAYQQFFPEVQIKKGTDAKKKWYTTNGGGVYATSAAGQVTGFGAGQVDEELDDNDFPEPTDEDFAGAIIIDDPIKPEDADSDTVRERVNMRFDSTIRNRVNSRKTPIVIIMQRLHPNDLCGYLQRPDEQDKWEIISLPCLIPEGTGWRALWPFKETVEELFKQKKSNEVVFGRQKQQDPMPKAGLMFPKSELNFYTHDEDMFEDPEFRYLAADPANLGGDDFAALDTALIGNKIYVPEVLYNTEGTDINEPAVVDMILRSKTRHAGIEGVFGWDETVKRIRETVDQKDWDCEIRSLKPRQGKHSRIMNRSSFIKNNFYFREDYMNFPQYAKFINNLCSYLKIQQPGLKNKHDEAPDVCEMAAGYYEKNFPELFT